jgi:hypothetical protein
LSSGCPLRSLAGSELEISRIAGRGVQKPHAVRLDASVFARWIKPRVRKIAVDKAYFKRHGG